MIKRHLFLFAILLLSGCGKPAPRPVLPEKAERIISLAPNITETIYALGLENKLIGVTTYCNYPKAAQSLPKVGGFGNFNFEAIVTLKPDLVILHKEYDIEKTRLTSLGIPYLESGSYFIADILETILAVGTACGSETRAQALVLDLQGRIEKLKVPDATPPRVLITFGREQGTSEVEQVQAFGPDCIHNELLEIAGGKNVIEGRLPYATLSREAVLRLNPDIIIELAPELDHVNDPAKAWSKLTTVNAVQNNRIYVLTGDYTCIPGPRFIQTLEDFARILRQNNFVAE
jgi:iron complex transport system substrate-binding protein